MNVEVLSKVYLCSIAAGFAIPLFQVAAGAVGGALSLDFDLDGDSGDGPFPGLVLSLAFFAAIFGAVGRLSLGAIPDWAGILAAAGAGALGAFLLNRLIIRPLRRSCPSARRMEELRWQTGRVKLEIRDDFVGTITVLSSTGSQITYSARPIDGVDKITVGEEVMIVEVDAERRIFTVSPMKKRSS